MSEIKIEKLNEPLSDDEILHGMKQAKDVFTTFCEPGSGEIVVLYEGQSKPGESSVYMKSYYPCLISKIAVHGMPVVSEFTVKALRYSLWRGFWFGWLAGVAFASVVQLILFALL